jgi:hypothetical protein
MSYAPVSLKQGDSIAAYRIVRVSGASTVAACSATTDIIVGVTDDEAQKSTQAVPVMIAGIGRVYCNDTMSAGTLIKTDASGRGVPFAESTAGVYVLGVCLDTVASTGTIARVLINPFRANDVP